ncbi:MAG: glycerophosphodiester phosphodiesterase [Rhodospirillaceae bacterium]|jgi:glycerophosphoryl diester phosphodiesterase|nr:glycerophosphodiester phosphodiesterase [Rhodospirillaceae bacterium]
MKVFISFLGLMISLLAVQVCADPLPWPLVIAHRGASGTLPEHTLEAYALAIEQGAHFIEPDLVSTRDGVLVARHENELSDTTDAAEKFPDRKTTHTVDGREITGWFVEDFTVAEIKSLRATERLPFRNQSNNGKFSIPTLEDVLALIQRERVRLGRSIGVYPETKHPSYFRSIGLPLEGALVSALNTAGLDASDDWVFIQSFEVGNLKALNAMTDVRLVQLLGTSEQQPYDQTLADTGLTYGSMISDQGLAAIADYADGIGPWKVLIVPQDREGNPYPATDLISRAHAAGLVVHAYTFRNEPKYLIKPYNAKPQVEYERYFSLGLDGVFSDFPATALKTLPR